MKRIGTEKIDRFIEDYPDLGRFIEIIFRLDNEYGKAVVGRSFNIARRAGLIECEAILASDAVTRFNRVRGAGRSTRKVFETARQHLIKGTMPEQTEDSPTPGGYEIGQELTRKFTRKLHGDFRAAKDNPERQALLIDEGRALGEAIVKKVLGIS